MSKLNIDQKNIKDLFTEKQADFLIPDYQRPYAWDEKECQTLWDDLFSFAFPENSSDKFNSATDEYFLGPIVTFKNSDGKKEIIDGQQRLTTLLLLLRAFYATCCNMKDDKAATTSKLIAQCIWKTDEFDTPIKTELKINSEVASDDDKVQFLDILKTGQVKEKSTCRYALNFRFFCTKINELKDNYPDWFSLFPMRIMKSCILLPIEAESQDSALRIFSTLNDRGKPLSDADIFKAQLYKYFSSLGKKDSFVDDWKELEVQCEAIFHPVSGSPLDELFTRYMYFKRAQAGNKSSTTEALRKFYEGKNNYALLKEPDILTNLKSLADFWQAVQKGDTARFSERVRRCLFVLRYAPNGMWTYFVSVYFMINRDQDGNLEEAVFYEFLKKSMAFIWAYTVTNPGVNALRTPLFAEMLKIVNHEPVSFPKFDAERFANTIANYTFSNNRAITKSMLAWWAFQDPTQPLFAETDPLEIEHIFSRARQIKEQALSKPSNLESLGNKVLLEKRINIRASDYRFEDKKKYYLGFTNGKNEKRAGTAIRELSALAESRSDFTELDIVQREAKICQKFQDFLRSNGLIAVNEE